VDSFKKNYREERGADLLYQGARWAGLNKGSGSQTMRMKGKNVIVEEKSRDRAS
jgi:hypothetical protein